MTLKKTVPGEPARRPFEVAMKCLELGAYVRYGGDTLQLAPPFVVRRILPAAPTAGCTSAAATASNSAATAKGAIAEN